MENNELVLDTKPAKDVKKAVVLNAKESEFLEKLISSYENEKSLNDSQKILLSLSNKKDKSNADIKTIKSLLKAEKIVFDNNEKQRKNAEKMDKLISSGIRKAVIEGKKFDDRMTYKQVLQKMLDDEVIANAEIFDDFMKNA